MKVQIKNFDVAMELKNKGIEIDVSDNQGTHLGDLYVTKTQLVWCKGKIKRENGKTIDWASFMEFMNKR